MKKVVYCDICKTKMIGYEVREYGGKYYCASHYSQQLEKPLDNYKESKRKEIKKLLYGG